MYFINMNIKIGTYVQINYFVDVSTITDKQLLAYSLVFGFWADPPPVSELESKKKQFNF